jgi:hypothetical protein
MRLSADVNPSGYQRHRGDDADGVDDFCFVWRLEVAVAQLNYVFNPAGHDKDREYASKN